MHPDFAGVEHGDAKDVTILRGARSDDFREEGYTDAHDLAGLAGLEVGALAALLFAKSLVADLLHSLPHGRVIIARMVLPAESGLVGELVAADEILYPQFGGIHFELLGQDIHGTFDAIGGLGYPERAAVGNAAGALLV